MNRAVLDASILVSAGITEGGNWGRVVQMALKKELGLVVSPVAGPGRMPRCQSSRTS
jgi:predicted nucleic acid-binding protein